MNAVPRFGIKAILLVLLLNGCATVEETPGNSPGEGEVILASAELTSDATLPGTKVDRIWSVFNAIQIPKGGVHPGDTLPITFYLTNKSNMRQIISPETMVVIQWSCKPPIISPDKAQNAPGTTNTTHKSYYYSNGSSGRIINEDNHCFAPRAKSFAFVEPGELLELNTSFEIPELDPSIPIPPETWLTLEFHLQPVESGKQYGLSAWTGEFFPEPVSLPLYQRK